jgi:hypothetical protein
VIGIILGAVFLVVGVLMIARGLGGWYLSLASSAWPSTSGTVIVSDVQANSAAKGGEFYRVRVEYRYEVGGNEFVGNCLFFGDWVEVPMSFMARRYTDRYRQGSKITVFYDPRKPWNAVVEPGVHGLILYGCLGGFVFALFGFLVVYYQEM